jgi:hypothetical protein
VIKGEEANGGRLFVDGGVGSGGEMLKTIPVSSFPELLHLDR